jgi:ATP-dependent Lhr-like helicase
MTSPPSRSDAGGAGSSSFELLDEGVQRWIHRSGWQQLRPIQERAIRTIHADGADVIVAAPTAAGKTEAAFLPICSDLAANPVEQGLGAIYVSPLKALINDQLRRLQPLCESVDVPVRPWHGDVPAKTKLEVREKPEGILLITPESLESIFVNHGTSAARLYSSLRYVVIDELHAFIGSERGRQLQALLHRIELAKRQRVVRVGLSATLGDMSTATEFMRPGEGTNVELIEFDRDHRELLVQLRGYLAHAPRTEEPAAGLDAELEDLVGGDRLQIADHLYGRLRGQDNLVFANKRSSVEQFADLLGRRSERERVPNEFFPHHGNLSKNLREEVEQRLRERSRPTTAICTSTLELGIDVGSVSCVGQIDPPFSAAALRQRLGRCGRRPEDPSVLRMYVSEEELEPGAWPGDALREGLVQSIAVVEALIDAWFEPPVGGALHLSTLVQQVLSVIAQHGGAKADQIWQALCDSGPFDLDQQAFAKLLRGLAERGVIQQTEDGDLILAPLGERIVGHFNFYSAFLSPEEYRLLADGEEIGSLPISSPLTEDSFLIFAGRRWKVLEVDNERKVIVVAAAKGGRVPQFNGKGGGIHDGIRRRMRKIYESDVEPEFLDSEAKKLLAEGRRAFAELRLTERQIVPAGGGSAFFPWAGDRVISTIALGLGAAGHDVTAQGLLLAAPRTPPKDLAVLLQQLFGADASPDAGALAAGIRNLETEKHHRLIDPELLMLDCAVARLDVAGAQAVVAGLPPMTGDPSASVAPPQTEYVVLDCETTGLHPSAHHRIVELALITVDGEGRPIESWSSLLRPERDLGPTAIHGIRAREVADAPSFEEVLGEILDRIAGRVVVAHNAGFDKAFLEHELARSGLEIEPLPTLCTMELATRLGIGGTRRRLSDCCEALGPGLENGHTALGDAAGAGAVLAAYLSRHGPASGRALVRGQVQAAELWPRSDRRAPCRERSPAFEEQQQQQTALQRLIEAADLPDGEVAPDVAKYLDLLDRAIEDRQLDGAEQEELVASAAMLGIDSRRLAEIHRDYVGRLVALAWRDGGVSEREREDLFLVAQALGVDGVDSRLEAPESRAPHSEPSPSNTALDGRTVCFTGALCCRYEGEPVTREVAEQLAEGAGLTVLPRVTKKLDLLVIADPDSASEKARKAREYGTRIIAETAFWEMIGVEVT